MPRKPSGTEEQARNLLLDFLKCLNRRQFDVFLQLLFNGKVPAELKKHSKFDLHPEYKSIGKSRADLVICAKNILVCVEVKLGASEQLGQYIKYRDYYRREYKTIYVAGLVKKFKKAGGRKDNEPFFEWLNIHRVLWSEVLTRFKIEFGDKHEFKEFLCGLSSLDAGIEIGERLEPSPKHKQLRMPELLASNNWVLAEFFRDLQRQYPGWDVVPNQYGNAAYELQLGKRQWAKLLQEKCCRRICVALNHPKINEPYFALCISLWNRTWFDNDEWFLNHRHRLSQHFQKLGFQLVRNRGSNWHSNEDWLPPFDKVHGLKYVNAFWEKQFSLSESEFCRLGWDKSLGRIQKEIKTLTKMIDDLNK